MPSSSLTISFLASIENERVSTTDPQRRNTRIVDLQAFIPNGEALLGPFTYYYDSDDPEASTKYDFSAAVTFGNVLVTPIPFIPRKYDIPLAVSERITNLTGDIIRMDLIHLPIKIQKDPDLIPSILPLQCSPIIQMSGTVEDVDNEEFEFTITVTQWTRINSKGVIRVIIHIGDTGKYKNSRHKVLPRKDSVVNVIAYLNKIVREDNTDEDDINPISHLYAELEKIDYVTYASPSKSTGKYSSPAKGPDERVLPGESTPRFSFAKKTPNSNTGKRKVQQYSSPTAKRATGSQSRTPFETNATASSSKVQLHGTTSDSPNEEDNGTDGSSSSLSSPTPRRTATPRTMTTRSRQNSSKLMESSDTQENKQKRPRRR